MRLATGAACLMGH